MKIFIFEQVEQLTDNYHGGGGLVIIAESEEHAKELIKADKYINPSDEEWWSAAVYRLDEYNISPTYYVFPDAGCC